jgi:PD-(D/E)XK endonuclease
VLTTNQKGAVAETAITHEAVRLGIGVSRPVLDLRYDLIFDVGDTLLRVQCKWASRAADVIVVRFYAARRARSGILRSFYDRSEIDAFAAYCGQTGACYFFPIDEVEGMRGVFLRLQPTRNNQSAGIRWAGEYEFPAKLRGVLGP